MAGQMEYLEIDSKESIACRNLETQYNQTRKFSTTHTFLTGA